MTIDFTLEEEQVTLLVKCLVSLPNLHTLEIAWFYDPLIRKLRKTLRRVKLPQIKTLILPVTAYPLLEHCPEVEDVVCIPKHDNDFGLETFLRSISLNRNSKIRRLAIPLTPTWNEDKPFRK